MDIELAQTLAENKLLKSLLYCTKRSCNNCGKVTCENFQRQRVDCCGNWVSYKVYINELEQKLETERSSRIALVNKIADLEAQIEKMKNCKNCKKLKKEKDGLLICTVGSFYTNTFGKNCDKWEIKEND